MTTPKPKPRTSEEIDMQHRRALNALLAREFFAEMGKPLIVDLLKRKLKR